MNRIIYLFIYLFIYLTFVFDVVYGQNPYNRSTATFDYGTCLKEVHFEGTPNSNYIPITKDNGSGIYTAPHFEMTYPNGCGNLPEQIVKQAPVAYVSGTYAKVKAVFETDCQDPHYIRGAHYKLDKNGKTFFPKVLISPDINGIFTYGPVHANFPFENNRVRYWENFKILWQISKDGINWIDIDISDNPLYVTYKTPEPESISYQWFHTLFKVSCKAADGENNDTDIINEIWNEIKTLSITAADNNQPLTYYKNWITAEHGRTKQLLNTNDGQCSTWAHFLIDLLKVHNINHATVDDDYYYFRPFAVAPLLVEEDLGFFINNWSFNKGILSDKNQIFNYTCIPKQSWDGPLMDKNWYSTFIENNQYNFVYSDCTDIEGIYGQGPNKSPQSFFLNHQITQIDNQLKDPSYGVNFASLQDIENTVISAYYIEDFIILNETLYDIDEDGSPDDLNGNAKIEYAASVKVYLVSTDKGLFDLERDPDMEYNH